MQVAISAIKVPERIRSDLGDLNPLMESLTRCGQLNPITVTRDMVLIAGHRRLEAATQLGWRMIDATVIDGIDEVRRTEIELEENIHRKDFSPEELLEGMRKLEKLRRPKPLRRMARAIGKAFSALAFWRYFGRRKKERDVVEQQNKALPEPVEDDFEPGMDEEPSDDREGADEETRKSGQSGQASRRKKRSKSRRQRNKSRQSDDDGTNYGV